VKTPRPKRWYTPEEEAEIVVQQRQPARIEPADVAPLVMFLASDDPRMRTGRQYWIDAGRR
jgi:NAD(P)-dependent dehydrogenase (short-subunit alcohol dehydrogenase family)